MALLDWPDVAERRSAEQQDAQAHAAMRSLGLDPQKIFADLAARAEAQAQAARDSEVSPAGDTGAGD